MGRRDTPGGSSHGSDIGSFGAERGGVPRGSGVDAAVAVIVLPSRHFGWRELRAALRRDSRVSSVREAHGIEDAERQAEAMRPGAVFLAGDQREQPLVAVVAHLRAASPGSGIVVVGGKLSPELTVALWRLGVAAVLCWEDMTADLPSLALSSALLRGAWFCTASVSAALASEGLVVRPVASPRDERGRRVLRSLAAGLSHHDAAKRAGMSPAMFNRVLRELKDDFNAPNTFVLAMWALALGIVWFGEGGEPQPEAISRV